MDLALDNLQWLTCHETNLKVKLKGHRKAEYG